MKLGRKFIGADINLGAIQTTTKRHEPELKASLEQELSEYKLDIEIVDILRDKKDLQLKRYRLILIYLRCV